MGYFTCDTICDRKLCNKCPKWLVKQNSSYSDYFNVISGLYRTAEPPGGPVTRHIVLELPTIKTDFLFENSQDFNQTTRARPQHPIVFIDNISLYFNCISSVEYVFR